MIFITLGSQKFQFDRLLKEVDRLIEIGIIKTEVFAQIGCSTYLPRYFKYKKFLGRDEFEERMNKCHIVITHGGTGAIITALKNKKKVIAVPRLKIFEEHVDNHQLEIVKSFYEAQLIEMVNCIDELKGSMKTIECGVFREFQSNNENFVRAIENLINN